MALLSTHLISRVGDYSADRHLHTWRAEQLQRLGLPAGIANAFADVVDWHQIEKLVDRGCSPLVALTIVF
jgi:hypothetical protein